MKTSREIFSLDEILKILGVKWTDSPHIFFNKGVDAQYEIRRQHAHDGTLLFSLQLMKEAMMPLFLAESYFKPAGPPSDNFRCQYTIGVIKLFSIYGLVNICGGRYPGEKQRIVIPVKCEYVPIK